MRFGIRNLLLLAASTVLLILPLAYLLMAERRSAAGNPVQVLKYYLKAVYARDYRGAYKWISTEDRKHKSEVNYLRENPSFSGPALELTRKLAEMIEFSDLRTEIQGNRATIRFLVRLPDANAPALQKLFLDFDPDRLARLSTKEMQAVKEKLESMRGQGHLSMIEGEDSS